MFTITELKNFEEKSRVVDIDEFFNEMKINSIDDRLYFLQKSIIFLLKKHIENHPKEIMDLYEELECFFDGYIEKIEVY